MCREGQKGIPVAGAVEVIPGRLYWASTGHLQKDTADLHFFSTDAELVYEPFCADFGPLNLSCLYKYCKLLDGKMADPRLANKRLVHICSPEQRLRANAACLVAGYLVVVHGCTGRAAFAPFAEAYPPFLPFRDAINGPCSFQCTILDCLEGLETGISLGWFNYKTFNLAAYDQLGRIDQCDANWIIPGKFLAFTGPSPTSRDAQGFPVYTPDDCAPVFKSLNIGLVIRLNTKQYDKKRFTDHNMKHLDLFFQDGSCPAQTIISKFLYVTESEPSAVAVHCKAGLGRTCTLIGLYAMKHYRFPARAFIGWARICRPGSVLGPQQQFLCDMQQEMFEAGLQEAIPRPLALSQSPSATWPQPASEGAKWVSTTSAATADSVKMSTSSSAMSFNRLLAEKHQDIGQGERLCNAKRGVKSPSGTPTSAENDDSASRWSLGLGLPPITASATRLQGDLGRLKKASASIFGFTSFSPALAPVTSKSAVASLWGSNTRTSSR